jgi:ribosome-associated protein
MCRSSGTSRPEEGTATRRAEGSEGRDRTLTTAIRAGQAPSRSPRVASKRRELAVSDALKVILNSLAESKAEDTVSINITGKSTIGDHMVVASGRSQRHVGAIADRLVEDLKAAGGEDLRVAGMPHCDWVLVDAGDIIVHIFRPEVRTFYNIEKMWRAEHLAGPVAV